MQPSWQLNECPCPALPGHLLIEVDQYQARLLLLENEEGLTFDSDAIFFKLFESLHHEQLAEMELEYLYMELALNQYQTENLLNFIHTLGMELLHNFKVNKVYDNGQLPYHYCERRADAIILKRADLFRAEVAQELDEGNPCKRARVYCARHLGYC